MKKETILLFLFIIVFTSLLNAQGNTKTATNKKIEIYYFHPTERCPIDQSIEENTRQTMQTYFSKEVKNGTVRLQILNTDDKANAKIVAKFDINAQALYLVKTENAKEIKTDLTTFAFDYGKSNPQKFRLKLKDEIQNALK
jgi:hypothetical protein